MRLIKIKLETGLNVSATPSYKNFILQMLEFFWNLACCWFGPALIELRHFTLRILQALTFVMFLVYVVLSVMLIVERIGMLCYLLLTVILK